MGKFFRILTSILPYLWLILVGPLAEMIGAATNANLIIDILGLLLIFIVSAAGVVCSRNESGRTLVKSVRNMKIILIPFYVLLYAVGMALAVSAILPILTALSILMIILLAVIDYLILIDTSIYAVQAIIKAGKDGCISKSETVLYSILSFVFCLDVIVMIVLSAKYNKMINKSA